MFLLQYSLEYCSILIQPKRVNIKYYCFIIIKSLDHFPEYLATTNFAKPYWKFLNILSCKVSDLFFFWLHCNNHSFSILGILFLVLFRNRKYTFILKGRRNDYIFWNSRNSSIQGLNENFCFPFSSFPFRSLLDLKHSLGLEEIMAAGQRKVSCNRGHIGWICAIAFPCALCRQMQPSHFPPFLSLNRCYLRNKLGVLNALLGSFFNQHCLCFHGYVLLENVCSLIVPALLLLAAVDPGVFWTPWG